MNAAAAEQPRRKPNLPHAIRELRTAIHRLTEPTSGYENSRYIEAPGLYMQLHAAVYGRDKSNTGGGGSKSRLPFWTDAFDQLRNIDLMVNVWPTDSTGSTLTQLRSLAAKTWTVEQTRQVRRLAGIITAWADDIETLLNQPGRKYLRSVPCPACGAETVHHRDSAGEMVREPALKISINGCRCLSCEHVWAPDKFMFLAEVLGFERPAGVLG